MSVYELTALGNNISILVQLIETQQEEMRRFERGATEPTIKPDGLLWWCTDTSRLSGLGIHAGITEALLRWDQVGGVWRYMLDAEHGAISAGGEVPLAADWAVGSHKITGLTAGSAASHATRMDQQVLRDGSQAWTANQGLGGFKITGSGAPSSDNDLARKKYVDDLVAAAGSLTHVPSVTLSNAGGLTVVTCGFRPRRVTVRIYARLRDDDDGSPATDVDATLVFTRWDADAGSGFDTEDLLGEHIQFASGALDAYVTWDDDGFTLAVTRGPGGKYQERKDHGSSSGDGVVQAIAEG